MNKVTISEIRGMVCDYDVDEGTCIGKSLDIGRCEDCMFCEGLFAVDFADTTQPERDRKFVQFINNLYKKELIEKL